MQSSWLRRLEPYHHHNELDSAAAAYRIGICLKTWHKQHVVYRVHCGIGPIIPWFAAVVVVVTIDDAVDGRWAVGGSKIPSKILKYQEK